MELIPASHALGLYVHVPFCASTCDFCAFYQEKPRKLDIQRFLEGIKQEFSQYPLNRPIDTVFWGGGTPLLLKAQDLAQLGHLCLQKIKEGGGAYSQAPEWTVEMAPASVKMDKIRALQDLGVNRFSMGVQTFQPQLLEKLGRQHTRAQIDAAWECLQQTGVSNLNLDLMFSLPGQTAESVQQDLEMAISLKPQHLSLYCLTFEEDTALYIKLSEGKIKRDPEQEAQLYEMAWEFLAQAGYVQYEIANFAQPGFECIHNINTWRMQEWIGIGPSAASQYQGLRYQNVASLSQWQEGLGQSQPARQNLQALSPEELAVDALIFGLRMNAGVDLGGLQTRFPQTRLDRFLPLWAELTEAGLLEQTAPSHLQLTPSGRLLADAIGLKIISAEEA